MIELGGMKYLACVALIAATFGLTACGRSGVNQDQSVPEPVYIETGNSTFPPQTTISIVPKSLDNPVFLDTKEAAQARARELGIRIEWVAPFNADTSRQVEIVRWLIERNVEGILISCNDPVELESIINEGVAAGVKIATFDSDSPNSRRLFYIGTDNYQAGRMAAEAATELLGDNHYPTVVIVSGRSEAHNLNERIRGFQDRLEEAHQPEYAGILYSNDDINLAQELTEQVVNNIGNLDLIYFSGGWAFMGPLDSLEGYQNWREGGGRAVTIDSHYPILRAAQNGMVDALVGQDFARMGREGVTALFNAIHGHETETTIFTETVKVEAHQVPELLSQARNYELR